MDNEERVSQSERLAARRKKERQNFILNVAAIGLMAAIAIVLIAVAVTALKLKQGEAKGDKDPTSTSSLEANQTTTPEETTPEETTPAPGLGHVVCIDPGHGGTAAGETVGDRIEKSENLEMALLIQSALEDLGYTVVLTRSDDSEISFADRITAATSANAEAMVVLHRSSYNEYSSADTGATVYVRKDGPEDGTALGNAILSALGDTELITVNSVKNGFISNANEDYSVLRDNTVTSCVLILGNMSDDTDNNNYDTYKTQYAAAVAQGISNYITSLTTSE